MENIQKLKNEIKAQGLILQVLKDQLKLAKSEAFAEKLRVKQQRETRIAYNKAVYADRKAATAARKAANAQKRKEYAEGVAHRKAERAVKRGESN